MSSRVHLFTFSNARAYLEFATAVDSTTTTDSLGIVTLTSAAFRRGQLKEAEVHAINECADSFTRALSLANRYRAVTGKSLPLDDIPTPTRLRKHVEQGDFKAALVEALEITKRLEVLFQSTQKQLEALGRTA